MGEGSSVLFTEFQFWGWFVRDSPFLLSPCPQGLQSSPPSALSLSDLPPCFQLSALPFSSSLRLVSWLLAALFPPASFPLLLLPLTPGHPMAF